jgi:hypothetical protein
MRLTYIPVFTQISFFIASKKFFGSLRVQKGQIWGNYIYRIFKKSKKNPNEIVEKVIKFLIKSSLHSKDI